jgi:hypothetical protein
VLSPSYSNALYPKSHSYNMARMTRRVGILPAVGSGEIIQYETVTDRNKWLFKGFDHIFNLVTEHLASQQQTDENHGQKWIFKTAAGEIIEPNPTQPVPPPITGNKDYMAEQWPDINSQTGVPRWEGEPLDYPRALRDLFWCKYQKKMADESNRGK